MYFRLNLHDATLLLAQRNYAALSQENAIVALENKIQFQLQTQYYKQLLQTQYNKTTNNY